MRHQTFTTLLLLLVVAASGCGGTKKTPPAAAPTSPTSPPSARTCKPGTVQRLGSDKVAYAAIVRSRSTVSRRPTGRAFATFGRLNVNHVPTIFSARSARLDARCRRVSYLVQIPRRPNGVTGWVSAKEVFLEPVRARILVDLSQKRLMLYRAGRRVLSAAAAIGSPATPTPTGNFYVNQRLIPSDPLVRSAPARSASRRSRTC